MHMVYMTNEYYNITWYYKNTTVTLYKKQKKHWKCIQETHVPQLLYISSDMLSVILYLSKREFIVPVQFTNYTLNYFMNIYRIYFNLHLLKYNAVEAALRFGSAVTTLSDVTTLWSVSILFSKTSKRYPADPVS